MSRMRWSHHNRMMKSYPDCYKAQNWSHASELHWSQDWWQHGLTQRGERDLWHIPSTASAQSWLHSINVWKRFLFSLWICDVHAYCLLTLRHVGLSLILLPFHPFFLFFEHTHTGHIYCRLHLIQWTLELNFISNACEQLSAYINVWFVCFSRTE